MFRIYLLTATALIEVGAGLALLSNPPLPLTLLLGLDRAGPAVQLIARIAGAALLALGIACWFAGRDERSQAVTGLIAAMLLYNIAVAALLGYSALFFIAGIALWPALVLHVLMAVWCLACLSGKWLELLN